MLCIFVLLSSVSLALFRLVLFFCDIVISKKNYEMSVH